MSHLQGTNLENSDSFMPRSPISYWIDLVQWTSFLIKVLHTQNSLDWPWSILTIPPNLYWRLGVIKVCPLLLVVTSLIQWKWSLSSSHISVVLCQSSSISEAPWGLVQAKPCRSHNHTRFMGVCWENSRINVLVFKTGMLISFSKWLASSDT
jgi:hypothetical protein